MPESSDTVVNPLVGSEYSTFSSITSMGELKRYCRKSFGRRRPGSVEGVRDFVFIVLKRPYCRSYKDTY